MAIIDNPVDLHQMHTKVYWIFFQGSRIRPCYYWLYYVVFYKINWIDIYFI